MTDNRQVKFHIVHSVKGGCGKTTFSLQRSISLARKYGSEEPLEQGGEGESHVLYMDCDFRGSAVKALLYGGKGGKTGNSSLIFSGDSSNVTFTSENLGEEKPAYLELQSQYFDRGTLNTYIEGKDENVDQILVHGYTYTRYEELKDEEQTMIDQIDDKAIYMVDGCLDCIFCSSEAEDKDCFSHSMSSSNSTMMDVGIFQLRIRKLLQCLLEYGNLNGSGRKYRDIIFDMPPGTDEFANALLAEIRGFVKLRKSNIDVEYYNVTTMDRGHLYAAEEYIVELAGGSKLLGEIRQISCVFNEPFPNEFSGASGEDRVGNIQDRINSRLKSENISSQPKYYRNSYSREYYESCRSIDRSIAFTYNIVEDKTEL